MTIDVYSKYNFEEICTDLGISINDLLSLVDNKKLAETTLPCDYSIPFIIERFKELILKQQQNGRKSAQTVRYYTNFLNRFNVYVSQVNPDLSIYKLNEALLDDFLNGCRARKNSTLSPGTINTYVAILRRLLYFAQNEGYVNKDLRYRFERNSIKLLPRYFQEKQIQQLLESVKYKTHAYLWTTIIWFLLGTGLRVSELVNVRVKDFDIETNLLFTIGKGKKERYVPIYPFIKEIILEYLYLTGVKEWNKEISGFLFARDHGIDRNKKVSVRSVQYQIHNLVTKLGMKDHFNVHSFRHTFAVNCLKAGMRVEYLSQIMGHENPETTYTYIQLLPFDLKREVMEKFPFPLEKLLNQIYEIGCLENG